MNYWLHPEAEAELGQAATYYAEHASKNIALAFLNEFDRVVELIVQNPQRGARGQDGLLLYHFARFPYTVFYEENEACGPQIYAVAHQRRAPGYWLGRS